jgi:undecaprenyl pyrophosphate phosphatase UppP
MTGFQAVVLALSGALSLLWPIPTSITSLLLKETVEWDIALAQVATLQIPVFFAVLTFWLRNEILSFLFGGIRLIAPPQLPKTLDQVMFLILGAAVVVSLGLKSFLGGIEPPVFVIPVVGIAGALFFRFADRFGLRRRGLNHLRWTDFFVLVLAGCLASLPGLGLPCAMLAVLWFANFSKEAAERIFILFLWCELAVATLSHGLKGNIPEAWAYFGNLPSTVLTACSLLGALFVLDSHQRAREESLTRSLIWTRLLISFALLGVLFWKGNLI